MNPQQVLTVDQMREKLAGLPITPLIDEKAEVEQKRLDHRVHTTSKKLKSLENQVEALKTKRMTPAEIRQGIDLLFQKYDFSPVEELIITAQQCGDQNLSTRIYMFLTEFLVPKLKSVEVSGTVAHEHIVVIRRFGPDGQVDEPMRRVAGLPAPEASLKDGAERAVNKVIDAEVAS